MSVEGQRFYPGEEATAAEVMGLAGENRRAAKALGPLGQRRAPLSRTPYRLLAPHAIELFTSDIRCRCVTS